ncbi:hypothetical protein LINPERHAP2_LOCUS4329 [Linum perenne]
MSVYLSKSLAVKFNGKNYDLWAFQFRIAVQGKSLLSYLDAMSTGNGQFFSHNRSSQGYSPTSHGFSTPRGTAYSAGSVTGSIAGYEVSTITSANTTFQ